ncbi:MAG: hypothetical protein LW875_06005 [Proteobacteria bacterium]|jgi:hypothetical protein|nr:hypothetical protein [Pseudomonadota bacterium]
MNRGQTQKITLSLAILIGLLGLFSLFRFFETQSENPISEEVLRESLAQVPGVKVSTGSQAGVAAVSTTTQKSQQFLPEKNFQDPARDQFLVSYIQSKSQVFLSEENKNRREQAYRDSALFDSLTRLLRAAESSENVLAQQNSASEFLQDAMEQGSELAFATVLDVVQSGVIENTEVSMATREHLGGIAGELMFHYVAHEPEAIGKLEQSLPGPVSRAIFKNVMSVREANLSESLQELSKGR